MLFRPVVAGFLVSLLLSACMDEPHVPPQLPPGVLADVTSVAASTYLSCALRRDGRVVCWGTDADGASPTPQQPFFMPGLEGVEAILFGSNRLIALFADGSAAYRGDRFGTLPSDTESERRSWRPLPPIPGTIVQLAASAFHGCALTSTREVFCWGGGKDGQLGNGKSENVMTPIRVNVSDVRFIDISDLGHGDTCAVGGDGTVRCWGPMVNAGGPPVEPVRIAGITDALKVSVAGPHACALRKGGRVSCWGQTSWVREFEGMEGVETNTTAAELPGLENVRSLSSGVSTTCAVLMTGEVRCWGTNGKRYHAEGPSYQVDFVEGAGDILRRPTPIQGVPSSVVAALGYDHGCALTYAGTVSCWGRPGLLGNPPAAGRDYPYGGSSCIDPRGAIYVCYEAGKAYDVLVP